MRRVTIADDRGETLVESLAALLVMGAVVLPLIAAVGLAQASGSALQANASVDIPRASVRTALESYRLPYSVSPITSAGACNAAALTVVGRITTDALARTSPTLSLTPGQSISYQLWISSSATSPATDSFYDCPGGLGRQPLDSEAVRGIKVVIPVTAQYDKVSVDSAGRTTRSRVTENLVAPITARVPGSVVQ